MLNQKNHGITPDQRKDYQIERWGKASLTEFTDDELAEFSQYLNSRNPKFKIPRPRPKSEQEIREEALRLYIEHREANERFFNRDAIRIKKLEIFEELAKREPTLFGKMALTTFNRFWANQKIAKLASGKPRKGDS